MKKLLAMLIASYLIGVHLNESAGEDLKERLKWSVNVNCSDWDSSRGKLKKQGFAGRYCMDSSNLRRAKKELTKLRKSAPYALQDTAYTVLGFCRASIVSNSEYNRIEDLSRDMYSALPNAAKTAMSWEVNYIKHNYKIDKDEAGRWVLITGFQVSWGKAFAAIEAILKNPDPRKILDSALTHEYTLAESQLILHMMPIIAKGEEEPSSVDKELYARALAGAMACRLKTLGLIPNDFCFFETKPGVGGGLMPVSTEENICRISLLYIDKTIELSKRNDGITAFISRIFSKFKM